MAIGSTNSPGMKAKGTGISNWTAGAVYAVGDIVIYNNQFYKCLTAHTATAWTSNVANWQIVAGLQMWAANTTYFANTLLYNSGKLYRVNTTFTSGSTFSTTNLTQIGGASGGNLVEWSTATSYSVGDYVIYGKQIYRCTTAHISDAWAADISNWTLISGTETWAANTTYIIGQIIYFDGKLFRVETTFTSGANFNDTNLRLITGGGDVKLANVTNAAAVAGSRFVTITWTDPADVEYQGASLAQWLGTRVVRKADSAPDNVNDGTLIVDSQVRDQYATTGYTDNTVTNGTTYYYRFFPYTTAESYTKSLSVSATPNKYDAKLTVSSTNVTVHNGSVATGTAVLSVTSQSSGAITISGFDTSIANVTLSNGTLTISSVSAGTTTVTVSQEATDDYSSASVVVTVKSVLALRYGYKIEKAEADPSARVTYLYDAVNFTPAHMDYANSVFDYGSWQNVWFVANNKPCMLKSDGTVDYYLDPNNYDYQEDGVTPSAVSSTAYDGNAMSEIPLCWVYRYEDTDYCYEIVSNVQYDTNYKAYAHTRADGSIADVFYWSMFGGSGSASKIRSLAGQALTQSLTTQNQVNGATANGAKWYIHTWSQHELIRTLCVLLGKSTNTQSVFGNGNCSETNSASAMLTTGTLKTKGQFYGYNSNNQQVKVFHIERFWGDQYDRIAGLMGNNTKIYAKMTPEAQGYRISDTNGYNDTGIALPVASALYISAMNCSEFGLIPTGTSGSGSTYYCDIIWSTTGRISYALTGSSVDAAMTTAGAFTVSLYEIPTKTHWMMGCGLSCEQPA